MQCQKPQRGLKKRKKELCLEITLANRDDAPERSTIVNDEAGPSKISPTTTTTAPMATNLSDEEKDENLSRKMKR